ncbi:Cysteine protease atg4b [Gamsiella multidivaricata]|nr:Cysteine protease atg4b [Gamsiella multidivaricata]
MMRTGQSLLAQGFVHILLGREWRVHLSQTLYTQRRYTEILDWFVDEPDRPYGIHRIAKAGLALDKRIGEWFGPATVAHALKRLSQDHQDCPAAMLVPMDGTLHVSNIVQAATHVQRASLHGAVKDKDKNGPVPSSEAMEAEVSDGPWRPVLVMIPTRFGLDKLTEKYTHNLKQLFRIPQFLGIAGGRPGRSLYFVACQGDELYYYDPHFVKPRAQPEELGTCPVPSFHCPVVRSMDIMELDPSMLLGFLIQSREELQDLMTRLDRDMEQAYPLLTIHDDRHSSEFVRSQKRTGMPKVQNQSVNGLCRDDEDMKAALDAQDRRSTSAGKHEVGEVSGHVDYAAGALNRLQNGDSEDGLSIKSLSTDEEDEEDAEGEYENGD